MDPYLDTITHDRGAEIKERVCERGGEDEDGQPLKRVRAQTLTLLTGESEEGVEEPPLPGSDLSNYSRERLKHGLRYINNAIKRKITIRTQEFLKLYKDAYIAALESATTNEASQAVVKAMDEIYRSSSFYFRPRTTAELDQLMAYIKLRRLELLANYGDYVGQELQGGPPKKSTDVADELKGVDVHDLRRNVCAACGILGIDTEHMTWLIEQWADRNHSFDCQTRKYMAECRWAPLAEQLCRDLRELLNVAPDNDTATEYEKVLLSIHREYFLLYSHDEPNHWIPNEKAKRLTIEKLGSRGTLHTPFTL